MSIVKDVPFVYETEKDLPLRTQIKNRLNQYILFRIEKLGDNPVVTDELINSIEEGCKVLINDLTVRPTLAREHVVGYILEEFGAEVFDKTTREMHVQLKFRNA